MTHTTTTRGRDAFAISQWICILLITLSLTACVRNEDGLNPANASSPGATAPIDGAPSAPPADELPPVDDMPPPVDDMPPPVDDDPPIEPPAVTDVMLFEQTLYPHLRDAANFCVACHGTSQIPAFAVQDVESAYNVILSQQKVDLTNPELSRIYLRTAEDRHNCGGVVSCDQIAADFLAAIQIWAAQQPMEDDPMAAPAVSALATFADAVEGGLARIETNAIAVFTFEEGSGATTTDRAGMMTLAIEGMEWVDGGGLRNVSGKAQASLVGSQRLFDTIMASGAYSVEAWVIPDNTAQDGPARIVSYSQDTATRNFTLGQNAIYYQLRNRSAGTGANGTPALEALDPQTDTVLQHVVATFDEANGRKLFVNGMLSIEENAPDTLDWMRDQTFVLGNEVTNDRLWRGIFRLVAVHNEALSTAEIQQNFEAGVEALQTLRFDVSEALNAPGYIEMQVSQLDEFAYLFAEPKLVSDATPVPVKNIRVAVNGTVPIAAQSFRRVDTTIMQNGSLISPLGAVIPAALGPEMDQFHLEFERLGNTMGEAETIAPAAPPPPAVDTPEPEFGVRTFSQINDTMASLTGVDANNRAVRDAYQELIGALPVTPDLLAFTPAQQVATQRLATAYCAEVAADAGLCADVFGTCTIDGVAKAEVGNRLFDRFIGDNLASQPARAGVVAEVTGVIDDLGCAGGCADAEARTVLNATCAAVLASGATMIN